jgi:hypothetical protein
MLGVPSGAIGLRGRLAFGLLALRPTRKRWTSTGAHLGPRGRRSPSPTPTSPACGQCWFCKKGLFSCCDRTNPNAEVAIKAMGHSPAGLFGFSHMLGGSIGFTCI